MIKTGDQVRFLNAVGGGKVTRVDNKQNLVYVEDENGFEIPVLATECVVIPVVNPNTNFPQKEFGSSKKTEEKPTETVETPAPKIAEEPILEVEGGDTLRAFLAFFPVDIKRPQSSGYECYLINDSNYFLFYNFVIGESGDRFSAANGILEPNLQELICTIKQEDLNNWERLRIQLTPFKKEKSYPEQDAIDYVQKMNVVRFYKLHSFGPSEYFDEPHILIDLKGGSQTEQLTNISAEEIRQAMLEKEVKPQPKLQLKTGRKRISDILEVDLHINNLLDSTAGMSNADMLAYQMDVFHKTLEENKRKKGQRIVFIHGKGEGVLRNEIEKQLKKRYKYYNYQDASFREYGFGATMVTIR